MSNDIYADYAARIDNAIDLLNSAAAAFRSGDDGSTDFPFDATASATDNIGEAIRELLLGVPAASDPIVEEGVKAFFERRCATLASKYRLLKDRGVDVDFERIDRPSVAGKVVERASGVYPPSTTQMLKDDLARLLNLRGELGLGANR